MRKDLIIIMYTNIYRSKVFSIVSNNMDQSLKRTANRDSRQHSRVFSRYPLVYQMSTRVSNSYFCIIKANLFYFDFCFTATYQSYTNL